MRFMLTQYLQNRTVFITLIFTGILFVTSFFPIPQIVLLELVYFYEPLTSLTGLALMPIYFIINGLLIIPILLLLYITSHTSWIIISNLLGMLFIYPMLVYAFHRISTPLSPLLMAGIVFGILMLGTAIFKVYFSEKK
ncbi:hypothetical protein [Fodinibius sp. Rm-B-1B1-1]|uniref:hypothetical protein n=1 Tax=Fodinibius alkaliphilus TaxID=3140241 RepID=UPI003159FAC3